ncbi:MAG: hypothetical protein ACUVTZ_04195 [Armatimonadota bacterium]
MTRGLLLALAVVLLFSAPLTAAAAKKSTKTAKRKTAVAKKVPQSIEDEAWSTPKTIVKKPTPKATKTLNPTVSWSQTSQGKVGTAPSKPVKPAPDQNTKPDEKTEPKPSETASATTSKSAEEQEKAANALLAKDPKGALAQYRAFLNNNPDYKYLGDVYMNAYAAAEKANAPILDKIEMAGKAAMYLKQGRTRGPVDQRLIQKYENLTDKWINAWIEQEIRKATSGQ